MVNCIPPPLLPPPPPPPPPPVLPPPPPPPEVVEEAAVLERPLNESVPIEWKREFPWEKGKEEVSG